jgi:hypothetical protein
MSNVLTQKKEPKNFEEAFLLLERFIDESFENFIDESCREFTQIYVQDNALKDLNPELKQIFSFKLNARLTQFFKLHIFLNMNPTYDEKHNKFDLLPEKSPANIGNPYDLLKQIADDALAIFLNEIQKNEIKKILSDAKKGEKQAIYKLVMWEKTALGLDFIVKKIAFASLNGDKNFFERLAGAIKQKVTDKRKERNEGYKATLNYLIPFLKTRDGLNERQIWRMLNKPRNGPSLSDMYRNAKGYEISSLDDIDYFVKFLKRNKISP